MNNALNGFKRNQSPSFESFLYIDDKPDSKNIYSGSLKGKEKKSFILRVWLADNYVVSGEEESFSFEIGARVI